MQNQTPRSEHCTCYLRCLSSCQEKRRNPSRRFTRIATLSPKNLKLCEMSQNYDSKSVHVLPGGSKTQTGYSSTLVPNSTASSIPAKMEASVSSGSNVGGGPPVITSPPIGAIEALSRRGRDFPGLPEQQVHKSSGNSGVGKMPLTGLPVLAKAWLVCLDAMW